MSSPIYKTTLYLGRSQRSFGKNRQKDYKRKMTPIKDLPVQMPKHELNTEDTNRHIKVGVGKTTRPQSYKKKTIGN